jgi:anti-anti-sigma factor
MSASEHFSVEQVDGITIVRVADTKHFDTDDYAELQKQLLEFVEKHEPKKMLVDFSHVMYCSTALTNTLLMAQKRVEAAGGVMKLFGLSDVVHETLDRLKLADSFFSIHPTEADARAAV